MKLEQNELHSWAFLVCGQLSRWIHDFTQNIMASQMAHQRLDSKFMAPRPEKYNGPALLVLAPDSQEPEPLNLNIFSRCEGFFGYLNDLI